MKIAILGSRGIPNTYGGFEQAAEKISQYLVEKGHDITVYNPSDHLYKEKSFNGVTIKRTFSNEKIFRFLNVFIFDYLSLKDAVKGDYDIILELGYHPAAFFYHLTKKCKSKIFTHMAGMEWQRSKWNKPTQKFIKYLEKVGVRKSDGIIADNLGISDYLKNEYNNVDSYFLTYGAELFDKPDQNDLNQYGVKQNEYFMLLARFQKDNNIEMALDGYVLSGAQEPFLVVGGHENKFGSYLKNKFKDNTNIKFLGGVYDYNVLCSLRWYAKIYFHVHAVGGTNPSLLEAMASNAYIIAFNNPYNKNVLGEQSVYFDNEKDVSSIIKNHSDEKREEFIKINRRKIIDTYNWETVSEEYLQAFDKLLKS